MDRRELLGALSGALCVGLPAGARATPAVVMAEWWETVDLEHEDRVRRIKRIAAELGFSDPPRISSYVIPRSRLPSDYPVDMPVLRVVFAERTFFDTASDRLRPEGDRVIGLVGEALLREPPDVAIFVAGHTDNRGSELYNYDLSVRRAEAVAGALSEYGVGGAVLWRVGFGENVPLFPNTTEPWLGRNRRVEFLFAGRTAPVAQWLSDQGDMVCTGASPQQMAECRKVALARSTFEAVQVGRPRRVVTPHTPGAQTASPTGGQQATAIGGSTVAAAPPGRPKLRIDLGSRKWAIEAPAAF